MVDWLRLSGQRAEERSESIRTMTVDLSVVKNTSFVAVAMVVQRSLYTAGKNTCLGFNGLYPN